MGIYQQKYTTEYFKEKVKDLYGDEYVVLGECTSYDSKVLVKHKCRK